jgi:predicted ribosomally synthesized peptide with nif11-like leader
MLLMVNPPPLMTEDSLLKFFRAVEENDALNSELSDSKTPEGKAEIAVKHGHSIGAQDMAVFSALWQKAAMKGELSDSDLDVVAGGSLKTYLKATALVVLAAAMRVRKALS